MRRWLIALIAISLSLTFFYHLHGFLKKKVTISEFKVLTERKLSQLLQADVKIGKIRFGLLRQVSLSGLQIDRIKTKVPVEIDVEKIVIKYDLLDFINQKFKVPADLLLESPTLTLQSFISPFIAFSGPGFEAKNSFFRKAELKDGVLHISIPTFKRVVDLKKVRAKGVMEKNGLFHLTFEGELDRLASGMVKAEGTLRPETESGSLNFQLIDVNFLPDAQIPLTELNGKLDISENKIQIDHLAFKFRGFPLSLSGSIENPFSKTPKYNLKLSLEKDGKQMNLAVVIDLKEEKITGETSLAGFKHQFEGNILKSEDGFQLSEIKFNNGYEANGFLNYRTGKFLMKAAKERQRFSFDLNLNQLDIALNFNLDHFKLWGHDLTAFAKLTLTPLDSRIALGDYRFQAVLHTDYFVLDYHPLRDFKAQFEITPAGLDQLSAGWGEVSRLDGSVTFGKVTTIDSTLNINSFKLNELEYIGLHPMPVSFEGALEGKLRIIGDVTKPDITGKFSIHEGKIGDFKYDEATIDFYGVPPYLKLLDSKIKRKDNTFLIEGDLDFTLHNIFQKVKIVSLEKVIIWKGLDVTSEIEKKTEALGKDPRSIDVPQPIHAGNSGPPLKKIEAEYSIEKGKSLKVVAEEDENGKALVAIGPKLRF